MTDLEKQIYNTYLVTTRKKQNKPFSIRKDFTDFEKNPNYVFVKKVASMFLRVPHLNMELYFLAPYEVYPSDTEVYYSLEFYAKLKALHTYKQYMKIREMQNPDSDHQCEFIVNSLKFIYKFCVDNKISIDGYLQYKIGFTPEWLKHYVDNQISIYCLFAFDNIYDMIMELDTEHRKIMLGDLEDRFYKMKMAFLQSKKAKDLVLNGVKLIRGHTNK